ncbi:MAG: DUF2182 domain-containing protein [Gemmatimonadaceae bacterium]|nr:DUF2182 domain-containing protein [Gemmatimonadaceae bacterium]
MTIVRADKRDRTAIAGCILAVTALAWIYLLHISNATGAMAQMEMPAPISGGAASLFLAFAMWEVMMIGMMTPTIAPTLTLFAGIHRSKRTAGAGSAIFCFALGYLVVWLGFSAIAVVLQSALTKAALLTPAMSSASPVLGGAILLCAGVYQLLPAKTACLRQCRTPLDFLITHWRDGAIGALEMGFRHGTFCLGCCWALMCVLFVVGVMNLAWVGALTAFILFEKLGRAGKIIGRAGGVLLLLWGGVLILK